MTSSSFGTSSTKSETTSTESGTTTSTESGTTSTECCALTDSMASSEQESVAANPKRAVGAANPKRWRRGSEQEGRRVLRRGREARAAAFTRTREPRTGGDQEKRGIEQLMPSPVASGTDASARGKPVRARPSERRTSGFAKTRREPRTSRILGTEGVCGTLK